MEFPSDDWQNLVNREKYWSPAYKDVYRNKTDWSDTIDGLNVPFIFATEKACGHIEDDQSGTISKYSIPCRRLFEGLGMDYDAHDGQYVDKKGNTIAKSFPLAYLNCQHHYPCALGTLLSKIKVT